MDKPLFRKKHIDLIKLIFMAFAGIVFGFFVGQNFRIQPVVTLKLSADLVSDQNELHAEGENSASEPNSNKTHKIWTPSNPRGAEFLPPGIIVSESDLYLRRLWGNFSEDPLSKPKYLVAFTVGITQKNNIDLAVKKFSDNFTVVLFHYDGRTTDWDEFEWSKRAIHVSVEKQTKWWYAKRFLHPDIVATYDYIFLWDEDLGVEQFNAEEYIKLVKKHGLEISQPGVESAAAIQWEITRRIPGQEVHKELDGKLWGCKGHDPPCAGFVEIMAPVFSRNAWRCVWHMIQNDLVHGWGLDLVLGHCVEPAHEKIGVVDAQWIVHQHIPTLGNQGEKRNGRPLWKGVRNRCYNEWMMFKQRFNQAVQAENEHLNHIRATSGPPTSR